MGKFAGFIAEQKEEKQFIESFDQPPYEYTMGKKGAGDIFFTFVDENEKEYRVQFYTSGGLGKNVRRVYIGERIGSTYKDVIRKFYNPLRVIATMISATEEFLRTPVGMKIDGLAIDMSKKAAPRAERILRQVMKRSHILKAKLDVLDSTFTVDPNRSFIWTVRKGKDPAKVYDGPKVDGMLGAGHVGDKEQTRFEPGLEANFQQEVANLLLAKPFKEMIGIYSGSYKDQFRVTVYRKGVVEASKDGIVLQVIKPNSGESSKNYAGRVTGELQPLVDKFKKGLWEPGLGRFKEPEEFEGLSPLQMFSGNLLNELETTLDEYKINWVVSDKKRNYRWVVRTVNYPTLYVDGPRMDSKYPLDGVEEASEAINDAYKELVGDGKLGIAGIPGDEDPESINDDLGGQFPGYRFSAEPMSGDVFNVKIYSGDYLVGQAKYDPSNIEKSISDMKDDIAEFEKDVAPKLDKFKYTGMLGNALGLGKVSPDTWTKDLGTGFTAKVDLEHFHILDNNDNNDYVEIYELTGLFVSDKIEIKKILLKYTTEVQTSVNDNKELFDSIERNLSDEFEVVKHSYLMTVKHEEHEWTIIPSETGEFSILGPGFNSDVKYSEAGAAVDILNQFIEEPEDEDRDMELIDYFDGLLSKQLQIKVDERNEQNWVVIDISGEHEWVVMTGDYPIIKIDGYGIDTNHSFDGIEEAANAINASYDLLK